MIEKKTGTQTMLYWSWTSISPLVLEWNSIWLPAV